VPVRHGAGIPPGREFLLDYDVIEAFCVAGLPGRTPSTRGTYRSALYRLAADLDNVAESTGAADLHRERAERYKRDRAS
jgi:hypothetical protein